MELEETLLKPCPIVSFDLFTYYQSLNGATTMSNHEYREAVIKKLTKSEPSENLVIFFDRRWQSKLLRELSPCVPCTYPSPRCIK
jgi:hypothetical protein